MNKSIAIVRKLKRGTGLPVTKEIQVPYYTTTFSKNDKGKQSGVVFSMFDNLATITKKIYVIFGTDPRDQVIFFQRGKEMIFVPAFADEHKVVTFDPTEVWRSDQGDMPFDQDTYDAFAAKKYIRTDTMFSNLFGVEDEAGSVVINVLQISDFFG